MLTLDHILVRLGPSSTVAEWHTLVQTTESVLNDPEDDTVAEEVAFVDLSQAFSDLSGKPTPRQIFNRTLETIGEHNIAVIFVATERTFKTLREPDVAKLCTEEGVVLPEEVVQEIELLAIDRHDADDWWRGLSEEPEDEKLAEEAKPIEERNPLHGYAKLWGTWEDECSANSVLCQLNVGNMDIYDLIEVSRRDDY